MRLDAVFAAAGKEWTLRELAAPFRPGSLVAGDGPWEVEIGFGKGRYLLEQAERHPERRFLGLEVASKYYRMCRRRAQRRGLGNVLLVRGEALYLLSTVLPAGFASAVHVYFPDPWPKSRHHKRRLFDPETLDLVVALLAPGGQLCFATDHIEYGEVVLEILAGYPCLDVERRAGPWEDGARTNYEAKFLRESRPILRLVGVRTGAGDLLHPGGRCGVLVGPHQAGAADCTS